MKCMLYIRYHGYDIRVGSFKNREAAEEYFNKYKNTLKGPGGDPKPIYVESGKGREK